MPLMKCTPKSVLEIHESYERMEEMGSLPRVKEWLLRDPRHVFGIISKGWSRRSWLQFMQREPLFAQRLAFWHVRARGYTNDTLDNLIAETKEVMSLAANVRFFVIKGDPEPSDPAGGMDTLDVLRCLKDHGVPVAAALHPHPEFFNQAGSAQEIARVLEKVKLTDHCVTQILLPCPGYRAYWRDLGRLLDKSHLKYPKITLSLRALNTEADVQGLESWGCYVPSKLRERLGQTSCKEQRLVLKREVLMSHYMHAHFVHEAGFLFHGTYWSGLCL